MLVYNFDFNKLVHFLFAQSDGLEQTRNLARKHINQALQYIEPFKDCIEKRALVQIAEITISRNK